MSSTILSFPERVFSIVEKIPRGRVLTYGYVASIAGSPRAARIVGGLLYQLGSESTLPWHRVVNAQGGISTYRVGMGEQQRQLLVTEGVIFDARGYMDLKRFLWRPSERILKRYLKDDGLCLELLTRLA